jgi:hypothetical protein
MFLFALSGNAHGGEIIRKKMREFDRSDRFEQQDLLDLRERNEQSFSFDRRQAKKFSSSLEIREFRSKPLNISRGATNRAKFSNSRSGISQGIRTSRFSSAKNRQNVFGESQFSNRNRPVSRKIQRNRFQAPSFNL